MQKNEGANFKVRSGNYYL